MTIKKLLTEFYLENGIPENGGANNDSFEMKMFGLTLTLPNPKFRQEVTHIHDIQHVLNERDTSWEGEGFIAGWEISTGMWKYFPIGLMSLWAMGYSLWLYPKAVFKGFRKGLNDVGVIDLKISKANFMLMERDQLIQLTSKANKKEMGPFQWLQFLLWVVVSEIIFLLPVIAIVVAIMVFV